MNCHENVKISIKNLYKIFGQNSSSMVELVKKGISKDELLDKYQHVVGLNNINAEIKAGKITVIMGLSGSGKSTLIRHFNRLIEPTEGEILVDGENVLMMDNKQLQQLRQERMSMVFQKFALLPHRSVIDNAAMALWIRGMDEKESREQAQPWVMRVDLDGYENHYPHQLSGGMQQRVGLARALASNSEIMLMDEAFSALDPLIRNNMQDLLIDIQKDLRKTIVFITHDLDEALKLADHLVILKDGEIIQQGEPQYILLNPNNPYIEDFVSEINRARVLRVRSVMHKNNIKKKTDGEIDADDNLESVIALSKGNTNHIYSVLEDGKPIGILDMKVLVQALVPRISSNQNKAK